MARVTRSAIGSGATILLCAALAECGALDGLSARDPDAADALGEFDDAATEARTQEGDAASFDAPVLE